MKSEPSEYSITDLTRDGVSSWFGVRNYLARNYMRDMMQVGDRVLFYHSSCPVPGIYGLGVVASLPHADETQFEVGGDYYDAKSTPEKPIWYCVDVGYSATFRTPITLTRIREMPGLETMRILERGNRLSITPVSDEEWAILETMIGD